MREIYRGVKDLSGSLSGAEAERLRRFRQHLVDLHDYLRSNWSGLRNYAAERRKGLKISSAAAESLMSHLVNQRMGKRQPMRWSSEGAHLLLQVRCAVLDKRLDSLFREWFPNFRKQLATIALISIVANFVTGPTAQTGVSRLLFGACSHILILGTSLQCRAFCWRE
jgi:hypothetical protein